MVGSIDPLGIFHEPTADVAKPVPAMMAMLSATPSFLPILMPPYRFVDAASQHARRPRARSRGATVAIGSRHEISFLLSFCLAVVRSLAFRGLRRTDRAG